MALVTIRILDGPDKGKRFNQLATPVTIGREEGNLIQLNDHRVSRHHLKIYENGNVVIITDLQSTNGTKVNGELVRTWQLHPGDLITLGQSILLYGSATEIAERLAVCTQTDLSSAIPMGTGGNEVELLNRVLSNGQSPWMHSSQVLAKAILGDMELSELLLLHRLPPPTLPADLTPQQAAQMEAFLQYVHLRLRHLITTVRSAHTSSQERSENERITISAQQWQNIVDLHARISTYMTGPMPEIES